MLGTLLLERYRLLKPLGEGGFAKTYLAEDCQRGNAYCVIKHLTPANQSPQFLATSRRLFEAEAAALRRLGTHDRIPELIDAFETEGEFYLVQAYVDGESLSQVFLHQPLTEAQMIDLLEEVLPILNFIHQQQVIHRDIKPSNLMRRRTDGKLMLIDFGAVKEITTQVHTAGSDQFTVSIGTQGYAPPEQLAGRPRYSSDLYALGMTVIRGLTGRSPTEIPENIRTGELLWQVEAPETSPGLTVFLQRLTHPSVYQRYASAEAALQDLTHLDSLTVLPSLDFPETSLNSTSTPFRWIGGAITSLVVAAIVLLIRQLGGWMPLELLIYDEWVQRQPDLGQDDRLLLVEITEADLKALNRATPSDATLSQAIQTLQSYDPRVIGLDMYRDLPQGDGHEDLLETLAAENVIGIQKLGRRASESIPAPATVTPDRIGFNDFPVDPDGVIRRNLLFAAANHSPDSEVLYSFGLQVALAYLEQEDIFPVESEVDPSFLDLNGMVFRPLHRNFGGYRNIDDAGYQLLLQYRSENNAVERLSLEDVLKRQFTESQIRDRIVFIGTTAPSAKDLFYTPFSEASAEDHLMAGVMLHVQATQQILSTAMGEQSLLWAFPESVEVVWILLWAAGGSALGLGIRRPWLMGLGLIGCGVVLVGVPAAVFMVFGGWMPLLPASITFIGSVVGAILYRSYLPQSTPWDDSSTLLMSSIMAPF
ncbi:MAG: CHASE2 domain-containing protein, partial [Leptolyngbya sp. SIO1D8]|nr:CHASE2 domain-containing protein [Leptolyngbya sp. SIO1D8]